MIDLPSHRNHLSVLAVSFEVLGQQPGLSQTYWTKQANKACSIIKALDTYRTWSQPTLKEIRTQLDQLAGVCDGLTDAEVISSDEGREFWHDHKALLLGLADHLTDQILQTKTQKQTTCPSH